MTIALVTSMAREINQLEEEIERLREKCKRMEKVIERVEDWDVYNMDSSLNSVQRALKEYDEGKDNE